MRVHKSTAIISVLAAILTAAACGQSPAQGKKPKVVIVATGSPAAQNDALAIASKAGRVCFFAGLPKSNSMVPLDVNQIHYKELEVTGSYSEKKRDFQAAVALLAGGRFPAGRIVTHTLPLGRIGEAFPLMKSGEALKVCILPQP